MVVLGEGSPEMSMQGPGEGERGRMNLQGETCLKRAKPLENVSSRSEWLGSKDALGKGERQGWNRTLKEHLGKQQGSNQEGSESFKLWSMHGFKSCWSSELRMTLGTALETYWKNASENTRQGRVSARAEAVRLEGAGSQELFRRQIGQDVVIYWVWRKRTERRMGSAAAGNWSGQLASCRPHSPGQRRQADQARGRQRSPWEERCSHRMRLAACLSHGDRRGRFE